MKLLVAVSCFCLGALHAGQAADVRLFGVSKLLEYAQTNSGVPVSLTTGFVFTAFAFANGHGLLTNATVTRSGNSTVYPLTQVNGDDQAWLFATNFTSQSALDAAYPTGSIFNQVSYFLTLATSDDGTHSAALNLWTVVSGYPPTPQIGNFTEGQNIDNTRDFTLAWNSTGAAVDIVQITIADTNGSVLFSTPPPGQPGALNGTSTSVILPANTLPAGAGFNCNLLAAHLGLPNTNYSIGIPTLSKNTAFILATRPAPISPLLTITWQQDTGATITFEAEADRRYDLQVSTDFTSWTDLQTTNPPAAGPVRFTDNEFPQPQRYYRVQVGP